MELIQLAGGEKIYCGLVLVSGDQEDAIEWLDPSQEKTLKYNAPGSSRICSPSKRRWWELSAIFLFRVTGRAEVAGSEIGRPLVFIEELRKADHVRNISVSSTGIDQDVNLPTIIYPKTLPEALRYAVDQYVLSGENVKLVPVTHCALPTEARSPSSSWVGRRFSVKAFCVLGNFHGSENGHCGF